MQIFTNSALHVDTVEQIIYECQPLEEVSIHNLLISNNTFVTVTINLILKKSTDNFYCLPTDFELKAKTTLEMKPINLTEGDQLVISSNATGSVDVIASILKEVRDF